MSVTTKLWTLDEVVQKWGYDVPYEVIDGELRGVSPSFADPGRVAGIITGEVGQFNEEHELGEVITADGGFDLSHHPLILVAPDVAFVRAENIPRDYDFQSFFPGAPDLAVEVPSPSDRPRAVEEKIERYLTYGSKLVWKADPRLRLVEVRRPNRPAQTLYIGDVLYGEDVLPGFTLPVARIFREPRRARSAE
jgi:Uma2 family endonuclease